MLQLFFLPKEKHVIKYMLLLQMLIVKIFYVAISRAKYDCKLYSKDIDLLYKKSREIWREHDCTRKILEKVKKISKPEISKEEINHNSVNKEKI